MTDFFISYQQEDLDWARWIDATLREAGYSTIFQDRDFESGKNFVLEIDGAVRNASSTIAVLSPAYLKSRWTQLEYSAALSRDSHGGALVPVRVRQVHDLGVLAPLAYIDLVGQDEDQAQAALLDAIAKRARGPTETAAPFPGGRAATDVRFPTGAPPVSVIPFLRNPFFVGRESVITELKKGFEMSDGATVRQALSGLGGVGKTQIALEYAYRHRPEYRAVFWIGADGKESLRDGMMRIVRTVGLTLPAGAEDDVGLLVGAVATWLEGSSPWLLVLDNVEVAEDVLPFLPGGQGGHILATSRLDVLDALGVARPVDVAEFTEDDGLSFLLKRTQSEDSSANELTAATELVRELGGLPLGLEQAASFILRSKTKFADYLTTFRSRRLDLVDEGSPVATPYQSTVATTWQLNITEVEQESKAAAELLRLSAFLAPNAIPLWMIERAAQANRFSLASFFEQFLLAPEDWRYSFTLGPHLKAAIGNVEDDPLRPYLVIEPLTRYSLVKIDASRESFSVHRLLQEVIRRSLNDADRELWVDRAVQTVNLVLPGPDEHAPAEKFEEMLPHARAAIANARREDTGGHEFTKLLEKIATYHLGRGEYAEARPLLEELVSTCETLHGPNAVRMQTPLHNLGILYTKIGIYPEAEAALRRSLEIAAGNDGQDDESVAKTQDALGELLIHSGQFTEAETLHRKALTTLTKQLGPDHVHVGTACQYLSKCLAVQGKTDESHALNLRTLGIYRRCLPPNSLELATVLHNLGESTEDNAEAEGYFLEAKRIYEDVLGPDHLFVARTLAGLAPRRQALGDDDGAIRLLHQALPIFEASLGTEHLDTALVLQTIAQLYAKQGKLEEELPLLERAHTILAQHWGVTDPRSLQLLARMVMNHYGCQQFAEALPRSAELIARMREVAPASFELGATLTQRGSVLFQLKRYADAREAHTEALRILEAMDKPPAGDLAVVLNNIATTYHGEGMLSEAEEFYRRAMALFDADAKGHPMRAVCAKSFAVLLEATDRADEAKSLRG